MYLIKILTVNSAVDVDLKIKNKDYYLIKILTLDCAVDVDLKRIKKNCI